jgi:hypothetical protein
MPGERFRQDVQRTMEPPDFLLGPLQLGSLQNSQLPLRRAIEN